MATKKSIILFDRKAPTGKFKRPNHPDFHTPEEHRKNKFTGVRRNANTSEWEFWILGKIEKTVSFLKVSIDKNALRDAHVELFAMRPDKDTFK